MIKNKSWKYYSLSVFFGFLLISLFIFSLIGFLNTSNYDVFFGSFSTDYENNKGLIYPGPDILVKKLFLIIFCILIINFKSFFV